MNIYLVERKERIDYDEYDSFVCYAPDPDTARTMHPRQKTFPSNMKFNPIEKHWLLDGEPDFYNGWTNNLDTLTITFLDTGVSGAEQSVINTSFNAG